MKTSLNDLRIHLFDTIQALKDENKKIDIDTAKAIAEIGQVIVNSAKLEVEALKIISGSGNTKEVMEAMKGTCMMLPEESHVEEHIEPAPEAVKEEVKSEVLPEVKKEEPKFTIPADELRQMVKDAGKPHCSYWNCKKPISPTKENPNPLYCSERCEKKDEKVKQQNERLAEIKKNSPVKRGRPVIQRNIGV